MILSIYLTITAIELVVILLTIRRIKQHIKLAKEIGVHIHYSDHISRTEKFFIRLYENYNDMFYILGMLILILNGILSGIIQILINSIRHII
jgi:hypothetical protein